LAVRFDLVRHIGHEEHHAALAYPLLVWHIAMSDQCGPGADDDHFQPVIGGGSNVHMHAQAQVKSSTLACDVIGFLSASVLFVRGLHKGIMGFD